MLKSYWLFFKNLVEVYCLKKILIMLMFLGIFGFFMINHLSVINAYQYDYSEQDSVKIDQVVSDNDVYVDSYDENSNYYGVYENWTNLGVPLPSEVVTVIPDDFVGGTIVSSANSLGYISNTVRIEPLQSVTFTVSVASEGLYEMMMDYYAIDETRLQPSIAVAINGDTQYNEMYRIDVPVRWMIDQTPSYDRYGDELVPDSTLNLGWSTMYLGDPNYFFIEPLKFYLHSGVNEITITMNEGYLLLGDITIGNTYVSPVSYQEYIASHQSANVITNSSILDIQAEDYYYESAQNIRSKYVRDSSLTPYTYKNRVLNVLDENSFRLGGDSVTYVFQVSETGLYELSLKYMQTGNPGLSTSRTIFIDGAIPFEEMSSYRFDYTTHFKVVTLNDGTNPYYFYLEAGTHEITLSVINTDVKDVYHHLLSVLEEISSLAREINKITGGLSDDNRNFKLDTYIPNLISDLTRLRDEVSQAYDDLARIYDNDNLAILSELTISIKYFNQFIEDTNDIPVYLERFNEGENSIYGRINTILPLLIDQPLQLDVLLFNGTEDELPKASDGFFVNTYESIRAFLYTFTDPKYNQADVVDDQTIEIWVRQSRLYIQIMQRMIDEDFTSQTGIKVLLSVMPDENKIVLSNAAGTTPDAAMGLSVTKPFDFAIRGMLTDLRQLPGFYDLVADYNTNSFIPFVYQEGVYSIPETMDVKLLFYRKDIIDFLGVEPPQTWDEVVSLIPVLQKYDYDFYTPLGNDNSFKTFGETTPFIYQFHGDLYNLTGDKTLVNEDGAYQAFEFMTDLFSIYNIPITTSNFFQKFRTGQIPLGIGDGNTYIQLKYAAPELAGQWEVIPIPGVEYTYDDPDYCEGPLTDGRCIERWDPTYGTSSVIFNDSSKQDLSWQFFLWWFSKESQTNFTYNLQSMLGSEFLYMTANVEAFKDSAWPSDSKSQILEQWQWIRTVGKVPGDYLLERELSNAWNTVVNDGTSARVAIDDAVIIINRELKRKLEEFGYYENGVMVKEYTVPTYLNIDHWLKEDDGNE